jgi:hypothetical protein
MITKNSVIGVFYIFKKCNFTINICARTYKYHAFKVFSVNIKTTYIKIYRFMPYKPKPSLINLTL